MLVVRREIAAISVLDVNYLQPTATAQQSLMLSACVNTYVVRAESPNKNALDFC